MDSADRAVKDAEDALRSEDPSEMLSAGLRLQIAGVALTRAGHSGAGRPGRNGTLARALIAQAAAIVTILSGLFLFGHEQLDQRISRVEQRLGQRISGAEGKLDRRISRLETEMKAGFHRVDGRLDALEVGTADMQSDIKGMQSNITGMQSNITGMQSDITGMRSDITGMQSDIAVMQSDMAVMKSDIAAVATKLGVSVREGRSGGSKRP